jgi:antitoxin MazE
MVAALGLKKGDVIEIQIVGSRSVGIDRSSAKKLLAGLRKFRGRLPSTFRFDRSEANQRR